MDAPGELRDQRHRAAPQRGAEDGGEEEVDAEVLQQVEPLGREAAAAESACQREDGRERRRRRGSRRARPARQAPRQTTSSIGASRATALHGGGGVRVISHCEAIT